MKKRICKPKPIPDGYEPAMWRTAMYQEGNDVERAKARYNSVMMLARQYELDQEIQKEASNEAEGN